jgi:hypothetical protein
MWCRAVLCLSCSFDTELKAKNQEQANLTKQRLNLEKEQKRLKHQQEKKVSCLSAFVLPASSHSLLPCTNWIPAHILLHGSAAPLSKCTDGTLFCRQVLLPALTC